MQYIFNRIECCLPTNLTCQDALNLFPLYDQASTDTLTPNKAEPMEHVLLDDEASTNTFASKEAEIL
jgi:hypothetical protein